jgi:arylsulfatase A-like enzyme
VQQVAARPPNIILIITDDQSPMHWPAAGTRERCSDGYAFQGFDVLTPHVDALAAGGMVFTDANVATTVCSPSRYSMLTGRYASRCRGSNYLARYPLGTPSRPENLVEMSPRENNVAKVLRRAGYRTGFVGKCHFLRHDLIRNAAARATAGFKAYEPDDDPRDPEVRTSMEHNHGRWQAMVREVGFDWADAVYPANLKELQNEHLNVHNVEWTVDAARRFIEDSADTPFFLYFATTVPHGPAPWHQDPGGDFSYSLDADPAMTGAGYVDRDYTFMPTRQAIKESVARAGKSADTAYLTWLDAGVGAIIKKVRELGLEEDTLFVFTSDHGAWRHGKTTAYEGGARVPLIISWKARIPASSEYDGLVQNIDLAPTFLDLAGIAAPRDLVVDGISLKPALLEDHQGPLRDSLFMEIGFARAVKTKRWKYIAVRYPPETQQLVDSGTPFNGWQDARLSKPYLVMNHHLGHFASVNNPNYFDSEQLYDLHADPREERNLAESRPGQVAAMRGVLTEHLVTFPHRPFGEFVATADASLNQATPPAKPRSGSR